MLCDDPPPPPPSQDPDEGSIYYHPVYCSLQDENQQKPCTVRALYDYTQRRPDELTFCREAIITNVVKHEVCEYMNIEAVVVTFIACVWTCVRKWFGH